MSDIAGTTAGPDRHEPRDACRLDLSTADHAVTTARDFTRNALARWLIGEPVSGDTALVVCEMVANAAMHAGGPDELRLTRSTTVLRIEVTDASPAAPTPGPPGRGRPGGYGLIVLQRLCRRWGSDPRPDGKTVWAEVPLT